MSLSKFADADVAPRLEASPVFVGADVTTEGVGGGTEDVQAGVFSALKLRLENLKSFPTDVDSSALLQLDLSWHNATFLVTTPWCSDSQPCQVQLRSCRVPMSNESIRSTA